MGERGSLNVTYECSLKCVFRRHPAQHRLLVVSLVLELQEVAVAEEADGGERLDA